MKVLNLIMKYICPEETRTSIGNLKYFKDLRMLAKINRNNPTKAEKLFWERLKKYKYPFLRQKSIYKFILDFYCSKLLLAIEIDGDSHLGRENYDNGRDSILEGIGIKTIRFNNDEVLKDINKVFEKLEELMKEREKEIK